MRFPSVERAPRPASPELGRTLADLAFTLVEMVIALGLVVFVLVTLLSLVSVGLQTNKVSEETMRAAQTLSLLAGDLSTTQFQYASGQQRSPQVTSSAIFGFPLVAPASLGTNEQIFFLDESTNSPRLVAAAGTNTSYRVELRYLHIPQIGTNSNSAAPLEARLSVRWPGHLNTNHPASRALSVVVGVPVR